MFERENFGWLLGRPALSGGVVGWAGIVVLPDFSARVSTAEELDEILRELDIDCFSAFGCTFSENFVAALKPDIALRIAPKILDLLLAMRVASMRGELEKARAIDLLAECLTDGYEGPVLKEHGIALLEGTVNDINDIGSFEEVDELLRSLLRCLAKRLHRAGELRRYANYELQAHRVLLAQSRFRLLTNVEDLMSISSEIASDLRMRRLELVTRHAVDPVDFIASFEARLAFARRYIAVPSDRLTLGEFRDLLDELDASARADEVLRLVVAFLKNDANKRSLLTLTTTDGDGCRVTYDSVGTSTGRVVMKSPGVQWLEKKYRKYILPPEGYELRDLDYSCFEPTILAAVSRDEELLAACASDVYKRVGEWLGFEGADSRDLAKAVLLRFIYGQAQEKLICTISDGARLGLEDARSRLENLGRRLSRAFEFRSELAARAQVNGYMETLVGGRCLIEEGETFKALSHYLQGTGSLIFKRALVDIFGGESSARLVVPMHDAFLCAFPSESVDLRVQESVAAMRASFLRVVGVDLAKVTVRREF